MRYTRDQRPVSWFWYRVTETETVHGTWAKRRLLRVPVGINFDFGFDSGFGFDFGFSFGFSFKGR